MIVSNFAPRTTLTFNVHAKPMLKEQWGTWSINSQPPNVDITKAFQSTTPPNSQAASRRPKSPKGVDEQDLKFTCKVSSISDSPM